MSKEGYVKVLGSGCKNCRALFENAEKAVKEIGGDLSVEYITDMKKIAEYNVMKMPALVVGNDVVSSGKVLTPQQVKEAIEKHGLE